MLRTRFWLGLALGVFAAVALPAIAQQVITANQGAPGGFGAWPVAPLAQAYLPVATTTKTTVSGVSAAQTGITAKSTLRIVCDTDVFYRTGTDTPTAVTTDALLPAKVIEKGALTGSNTAIAFITSGGTGSCYVTTLPKGP